MTLKAPPFVGTFDIKGAAIVGTFDVVLTVCFEKKNTLCEFKSHSKQQEWMNFEFKTNWSHLMIEWYLGLTSCIML